MDWPSNLLTRPAHESIRLVALRFVERADSARRRLEDPGDAEALHDLRVALRRLRSWIRVFRHELQPAPGRKARRSLRRLVGDSGPSRDLEVQLIWLHGLRAGADAGAQSGIQWLIDYLQSLKLAADTNLRRQLDEEFDWCLRRLGRRIGIWRVPVTGDGMAPGRTTHQVLAPRLAHEAGVLREHLGSGSFSGQPEDSHPARIAAKRLRYLIEPFAAELTGGEAIVERLRSLQDGLGEVNDAAVMRDALAPIFDAFQREDAAIAWAAGVPAESLNPARLAVIAPGLATVDRALKERAEAALAQLKASWGLPAVEDLLARLDGAVAPLGDARPSQLEIERKYLLRGLPPEAEAGEGSTFDQGYLPGQQIVERIRRSQGNGTATCYRTIKAGSGVTRIEIEEEIEPALFEALWPLTEGRRLRKRRFEVPAGSLTWEVDQFLDRDLVLAELELPTESTPVDFPEWLAGWVVREVTHDPSYLNRNLAR